MSVASERRNPAMPRVPFEALVEFGAPDGASFEAESIDLSASGMHLKTAYLPKVGTPLTFRFESNAENPRPVLASGEVVWAHDGADGSEFGVRFDDLRGEHADAIRRILDRSPEQPEVAENADGRSVRSASTECPGHGVNADGRSVRSASTECPGHGVNARPAESNGDRPLKTLAGVGPISQPDVPVAHPAIAKGAAVRIHIEGVSAPMRAVLRDDAPDHGAVVSSELKMLRLGSVIELEDKERHTRRAARVEAVECQVDAGRVPQLVVKLRYDLDSDQVAYSDTMRVPAPSQVAAAAREARATMPPPAHSTSTTHVASAGSADETSQSAAQSMQTGRFDALPDLGTMGKKMGAAMSAAFSSMGSAASKVGARAKTTVALLTKRVDKSSGEESVRRTTSPAPNGAHGTKTRTLRPQGASRDSMNGEGIEEGSGVMQEIDSKKVARRRQIGIIAAIGVALILGFIAFRKPKHAAPTAQAPTPELAPAPPSVRLDVPPPAALPDPALAANAPPAIPLQGEPTGLDSKGNPNPFGNTSVKKGTRMVLRLDGPVAEVRGTQMPNGFVVSVPNRKSIEAAGPLAAKDARISSAKVVNQPLGAELTIAFKDEPPNYIVRAKGDAIEIILAKGKAVAKKNHAAAAGKKPAGAKPAAAAAKPGAKKPK